MPSLLARSIYTHNMCPLFAYAGYAAVRALVETKKKRDISSFNTYTVFRSLGLIFNFFKIPPLQSKNLFKTFFITFLYGSSQTSGRNEENTRYIILPHIRSVFQLRTYLAFSASWVYTHNICAIFDYAAVRASVETKKKQDISSLHTYAG